MDNQTFLKTVKPYFSDKGSNSRRITLLENDSVLTDDKDIAKTTNNFFINITENLNLKLYKDASITNINGITSKFDNHISINKIKESFDFNFEEFAREDVKKEMINLNVKKSSTNGSIPATILKQCVGVNLLFLTKAINHAITENTFPEQLKKSEVIPLHKKEENYKYPLKKENYRPVSLLPHVSKVFERMIYKQINIYMQDKLSKHITGFRKSHGTQHSLMAMLEEWKSPLDKGENIYVLFMDLSKAFDTINHDLLLAKLKAYGFSINALDLMCSYLKNRKQSVQINNSFSSTKKVHAGVPQGSIDGPLLFNLFINDSVLFLTDTFLSNYAEDNNLYSIGKDSDIIKNLLGKDFRALTEWFFKNYMVLNKTK